jgi:DNA-binding NarL/FixJ family response regulator
LGDFKQENNFQLCTIKEMPLSILIYEDDQSLRENLSSMVRINADWKLAGAFESAIEVERNLTELQPDIVFMDIDMPMISGIEAVRRIRAAGSTVHVIMLTVFEDDQHVLDAIFAGASGYLLKKHITTRFNDAVHEVLNGGAPMSPTVARMVISSMQTPRTKNPYQLTPREQEVLNLLSKGNSYKMIASETGVVIDTVRAHIKKIYEKLQVHSQTEAVAKALTEKLV